MAYMGASGTVHAMVAADGRVLSADPPLLLLHAEAGGASGDPLAVPQLAAIVRLAGRMGTCVVRTVGAASVSRDIEMTVMAQPEGDAVRLTITDWRERPASPARADEGTRLEAERAALARGWTWQVDTQMRFITVEGAGEEAPAVGDRLTAAFELGADAEGDMPILQAMAERQPFEGQRARRIGSGESCLLAAVPLFDVAGRLLGYRGTVSFAPAEAEGTSADEDLVAASYSAIFGRRLDRALRQPLGRIIANAETISGQLEGPVREDYAAYASDIASAGRHLMALVDDIADLEAVDRPDFATAEERIDLADIARRAAGLLAVKAADRTIRIDAPQAHEALPAIGEFRRVLQILVNLIGNALRYSPQGSAIWVRLEQVGEVARIIVADQGSGIAPEDHQRIFQKFERLGRHDHGGSGLGLYISRRLARAMGGDITVESARGQGARFILSLPADK